jgi:hypothetical protein
MQRGVQHAWRSDRGDSSRSARDCCEQHAAEERLLDECHDEAGDHAAGDQSRQVAVEPRLDLPHSKREQQRDQRQHQADARGPADAELAQELCARQPVAERGAIRQSEPAREHDEADQRDQHRDPVHDAVDRLDGNSRDQQPGRIGEGGSQQQGAGEQCDEQSEIAHVRRVELFDEAPGFSRRRQ